MKKLVLVERGARTPGPLLAALHRLAPRLAVASRSALGVELAIAAAGGIPILSLEKNRSGDPN